jgi:serine/threonine-protein kinase
LWWLVLVLLLALLAGFGGWWYGVGRYTETPRLLLMTEAEARGEAADMGLDVEIAGTAYSERVPAGAVVATDPEPGERVLEDGTVSLTLSKGKERYALPDLAGLPLDEAEERLADNQLILGAQQRRWSPRVDDGSVIRSVLPVGRMLKPGSGVSVVVSKGPRPIDVDDFVGKPESQAREQLRAAGFKVSVVGREFSDTVPLGSVISQDPRRGTAFRGDRIELVVSKGPELVEVPDLIGQSASSAAAQLEALGLEVDEVRFFDDSETVVRQSPGGGELVESGTTVTLYLV